jgi:3-oxoacyl-[acyl-carrier-protein] synthase II
MNWPAACATGLVHVIQGCRGILSGEYSAAITGAAELTAVPVALAGFRNMGALSSQPCRPFDQNRSGFNTGDGGALFLVGTTAFPPNGGQPLAYIRGWDTRSSSHHATAAEPDGKTLELSIRRALAMAGWNPEDVDAINAHGTGTSLNDIAEARAIHRIYAKLPTMPPVFSFKGAIGHLLGASAAVELALCIIAAGHGIIPGTTNLIRPDPALPPIQLSPWPKLNQTTRKILKISLGFGGPVATLALEVPLRPSNGS